MDRSQIIKGIVIGAGTLVVALLIAAIHSPPSAEALARQAYELRMKAMKKHCTAVGEKVAECYAGDRGVCDKLQDSIAWFTSEYGEYPELACSTDPAPLDFGDEQK